MSPTLSTIIRSTSTQSTDAPFPTLSAESKIEESRFGIGFVIVLASLGGITAFAYLLRFCIRKAHGERGDGRNYENPPTPPPGDYNWRPTTQTHRRSMQALEDSYRPIPIVRNGRIYRMPLHSVSIPEDEEMGMLRLPSPVARVPRRRERRSMTRIDTRRERRSRRSPSIAESDDKPPSYRSGTAPPTYEAAWEGRDEVGHS
ncbi:hypothetical protein TWF481_001429 [Arthrobotrys musiformis]|uniref:Uncharacterized protein n=1 Tax=Arthrobotrys musiformis TaxID=47236 RepID=A0AAV9WRJ1_9PEZI